MNRRVLLSGMAGSGLLALTGNRTWAAPNPVGPDPGIHDACIHLENGQAPWWASPAIGLLDPKAPADAQGNYLWVYDALKPGYAYTWMVDVSRFQAADGRHAACASLAPTTPMVIELHVGNPFVTAIPNVNTKQIAQIVTDPGKWTLPPPGGSVWFASQAGFTPSGDANAPDGPGHKCLIARCYPKTPGNQADTGSFHVPDDQHSAQHNISIAPASGSGSFRFALNTVAPAGALKPVALRIAVDAGRDSPILNALHGALERSGVRKLAVPQRGDFGLVFPAGFQVRSRSYTDSRSNMPAYEAVFSPPPRRAQRFLLDANLGAFAKGDACMFHVTQAATEGAVDGGITVLAVRV